MPVFRFRFVILLLIVANVSFFGDIYAQQINYRFSYIDAQQGLSSNQVTAFFKDSQGFLWFGTASGLNRYDGNSCKVFRHKPGDAGSVNDDYIDQIVAGPNQSMWIYTPKGWNKYDPRNEQFISRPRDYLHKIGLPHEWFTTLTSDPKGDFWFTFLDSGLYRYSSVKGIATPFSGRKSSDSLYSYNITSLAFDSNHTVWIAYAEGILERRDILNQQLIFRSTMLRGLTEERNAQYKLFIDKENDVWIYALGKAIGVLWYQPDKNQLASLNQQTNSLRLNSNIVNGIVQDSTGRIWIATDHGGINIVDKEKKQIVYIQDGSISGNAVNTIYKDDKGIIWIGSVKKGISFYSAKNSPFVWYRHHPGKREGLPFNDVNCFAEDNLGNLWIGTNGDGLIYFNRATQTYRQYQTRPGDVTSLSSDIITSLFVDKTNRLWIGTYYGGLNYFDGRQFSRYKHDPKDSLSLSDDRVWTILEDSRGRIWVGTLTQGLALFDRETKRFHSYKSINPFPGVVNAIIEDHQGNIWVGGTAGIDILDKNGRFSKRIAFEEGNNNTISHTVVMDILEAQDRRIWIATRDGLNCFDPRTNQFFVYRTEDGLPHNTIFKVEQDRNQQLWLSTPNGLSAVAGVSRPVLGTLSFQAYTEKDGLGDRQFNEAAALAMRSGELVFGGANGFTIFSPPLYKERSFESRLVFTGMQVFNTPILVGQQYNKRVLLSESVSTVKHITLQHDQNAFSFEFAALDYSDAPKVTYAYQLKGFSDTWIVVDRNVRKASFTGLRPGFYTLWVKARYDNGEWGKEPISITIRILPPFWLSVWAYCLYALLLGGILWYARYWILQRARQKFELEQERQLHRRNQALNMLKIHLFTNISHEFRTPLALITSPIEKLIANEPAGEKRKQFQLVQRNARRLLHMVNELLDFRKLELKELRISKRSVELVDFVRYIFASFSDIAERKNIRLHFDTTIKQLEMLFDPDKLERILYNLLSNALKFTPEGGDVFLSITKDLLEDEEMLSLMVRDTGIGIPQEQLEKIFERFFQNDQTGAIANQGSGIGLAITREFVHMHGGTIEVSSELGKGSAFLVSLPIVQTDTSTHLSVIESQNPPVVNTTAPASYSAQRFSSTLVKKKVLVVEDNDDYRLYIKDNLKEHFSIIEAADGREGWQKVLAEHPDLVVSDINMPELNGVSLCQKIKSDSRTSFIPCILLTVYSTEEHQLKGLETGANDYITKPFNFEILLFKIRNLLAQQDSFKVTYQRQITVATTPTATQLSADEVFVQKALAFVEKQMANPHLSVDEMSRELLIGRATLYKKMFHLTGKSPLDFIRLVRLQRAQQLLIAGELTIAEVAYEVGFNDPKYFTKLFKEAFDLTPSAYQQVNKNYNI